jgi:GNAT superfamily N-acetyltransferase
LSSDSNKIQVRALAERDLDEADRIARLAFGTFLKLADPMSVFGDREIIRKKIGDASSALGAYQGRKLVGVNVITRWGKFGWFGPLAVLPEYWERGVGKMLVASTMELFAEWKTSAQGLFTFADSPKHVGLYHNFGFYPRFLTSVMARETEPTQQEYLVFSKLETDSQREQILKECREICDTLYHGLDLSREIQSVYKKKLGDTVLLKEGSSLAGFAVCHVGKGTEGGSETCYVKFGAVPTGEKAIKSFPKLVRACADLADVCGAKNLEAGMNLGRTVAFGEMKKLGFKTVFQGVAMQRPNEPGYNRPEVLAIDDWR